MKRIELSQGEVAIVDDEDFEALNAVKWHVKRRPNTSYASRSIHYPVGKSRPEWMHRVVLLRATGRSPLAGEVSDHINGNGLDNRRANLRIVTFSQNLMNSRKHSVNSPGQFIGVCWIKRRRKWLANIQAYGKPVVIGFFDDEVLAMQARERYISEHPDLMARSNVSFIQDVIEPVGVGS